MCKISTAQTSNYCSAFCYKEDLSIRATAEASLIGDEWWVNRVIILPESRRGKGLGGRLLEELKKAVAAEGGKVLLVAPGGYSNKYTAQVNFYERHGFSKRGKYGELQVELKEQ